MDDQSLFEPSSGGGQGGNNYQNQQPQAQSNNGNNQVTCVPTCLCYTTNPKCKYHNDYGALHCNYVHLSTLLGAGTIIIAAHKVPITTSIPTLGLKFPTPTTKLSLILNL